jgi:hypothetical protein
MVRCLQEVRKAEGEMKDEQREELVKVIQDNTTAEHMSRWIIDHPYKLADAILEWHEKEVSRALGFESFDLNEKFEARIEPIRSVYIRNTIATACVAELWEAISEVCAKSTIGGGTND